MVEASRAAPPLRLVRPSRSSAVLVGRARELALLRQALSRSRSHGTAAFVLGEAGIGKSRLISELQASPPLAPEQFLIGSCPPLTALASHYAPFIAAFRALLRHRGQAWFRGLLGPQARFLAPIVPALGTEAQVAANPEDARVLLIEAIHQLLAAAAEEEPLVLVVEDAHWATESTMAVLASLLADIPDGVLLIVTAREEGLGGSAASVIGEATRIAGRDVVRPAPLSQDEVALQAGLILGRPLAADIVRAIHQRSGGNPFLVEELIASGDGSGSQSTTLLLRLAALPEAARVVLRVIALRAEPVDVGLLERATQLDANDLRAALEASENMGLLVADGRDATYRFRHVLLQEAVAEAVPPLERRRLHAGLAVAVEGLSQPEPGDLGRAAGHWLAAGKPERALPLLLRASDETARGGGMLEAISIAEQARGVLRALPAEGASLISEAALVGRVAGLLAANGDREAADVRYIEAITLSREEEERLLLIATRAQWLWSSGLEREAAPFRAEIAEVGVRRGRRIRSLDLLGAVVRAMVGESKFHEAEPLAWIALARARRAGRTDIEAGARAALGLLLGFTRRAEEGAHQLRLAGDLAAAHGDFEQLLLAAGNHVGLLADSERHEDARRGIEHWLETGRRIGLPMLMRDMEAFRVDALVWLGRWGEAEARLAELEQRAQLSPGMRLRAAIVRAHLAIRRGRLEAADVALAAALTTAGIAKQAHHAGPVVYWRARRAIAAGDLITAAALVNDGLDALEGAVENGQWHELCALAIHTERLRHEAGDRSARDRLARLLRRERGRRTLTTSSGLNPVGIAACRAQIAAEIAAVRGRPSADHWEAAALRWEQIANPAAAAEAWLGAADASFAGARPTEGRRAARRAVDLASPLGMRPLLERASALLQAADGRRRGAAQLGSGVSLTTREVEVLQLIAGGCTNREIAAALVIGEKTAATHVSNLLAKLGAARRTEAAVAALRLGLLVGEPPADASTADRGR